MFLGSGLAYAGEGPYTNSAHGSSTSGVERIDYPTALEPYAQGNCAHCHEQHASVGGTQPDPKEATPAPSKFCLLADNFSGKTEKLYNQSDNACFYCHTSVGSLQDGGITNENYSATFGGHSATVTGIMEAFNSTSYHNLYDIYRLITGLYGTKTFTDFPTDSNPCSGCHNAHIAKRNKANPGDPTYTAISKPSVHDNLWGDDSTGERMTAAGYGTNYQPPNYATSNLEPDGVTNIKATQAEKTPDYVTFCTNCHTSTPDTVWSTTLNRWLRPIDWANEKHGKGNADSYITVDAPYTSESGSLGYVLSCLDCHEPHGSPNAFLIRNEVNGGAVGSISTFSTTDWYKLCGRCHMDDSEFPSPCQDNHYYIIHHSSDSTDYPYNYSKSCKQQPGCHSSGSSMGCTTSTMNKITCTNCHYHGSSVNNCNIGNTIRDTF